MSQRNGVRVLGLNKTKTTLPQMLNLKWAPNDTLKDLRDIQIFKMC